MKIQEIRQLPEKKLKETLEKTQRELSVSRFRARTGQNQNIAEIRKLRKMVAQIKTLLQEKNNISSQ